MPSFRTTQTGIMHICSSKVLDQLLPEEADHYVPLLSQIRDEPACDLNMRIQKFLSPQSEQKKHSVFLLLGDAGSGKSLFCKNLVRQLALNYQPGQSIPVYIALPLLEDPLCHAIEEVFLGLGFSQEQLTELKTLHNFIFILDGFDEIHQLQNVYVTNKLSEWKAQVIITCRSQYLYNISDSDKFFTPYQLERRQSELLIKCTVAPFNQKQIEAYLRITATPGKILSYRYLTQIPGLDSLIKLPFLLRLVVAVLPELLIRSVADNDNQTHENLRITQAEIYDLFMTTWFERQEVKLRANTHVKENNGDIKSEFWQFCQKLAQEMLKQKLTLVTIGPKKRLSSSLRMNKSAVANVEDCPFSALFSSDLKSKMIRSACPLKEYAPNQYGFLHDSFIEYFSTRNLYETLVETPINNVNVEPIENQKPADILHTMLLTRNSVMLRFLADRAEQSSKFKQKLFDLVEVSKTNSQEGIAAANAISILVQAKISCSGRDFSGVNIAQSFLDDGIFDSTSFEGADLTGASLRRTWLRRANLKGAKIENSDFGEQLPLSSNHAQIYTMASSSDGKYLAAISSDRTLRIWNTDSNELMQIFNISSSYNAHLFFYSSTQLVYVATDHLDFWDVTSDMREPIQQVSTQSLILTADYSPVLNAIIVIDSNDIVQIPVNTLLAEKITYASYLEIGTIKAVKISPDGGKIVFFAENGFSILDLIENKILATYFFTEQEKLNFKCSKILAIFDHAKLIAIEINVGYLVFQYEHQIQYIAKFEYKTSCQDIIFTHDGKNILAAFDKEIVLWNIEERLCLGTFRKDILEISTGNRRMEVTARGILKILLTNKEGIIYLHIARNSHIFNIVFDLSLFKLSLKSSERIQFFGNYIARSFGSQIELRELLTGHSGQKLSFSAMLTIDTFAISASGKWAACAGTSTKGNYIVSIKNLVNGEIFYPMRDPIVHVFDLSFSSRDEFLAIAGYGYVFIVSTLQQQIVYRWKVEGVQEIKRIRFANDMLIYTSVRGNITLWQNGEILVDHIRDITRASDVAKWDAINCMDAHYSPANGSFFVFGNDDGGVIKNGGPSNIYRYKRHASAVTAVSISASGQLIASGGADGMICLWDAKSSHCLAMISAHNGAIDDLLFSADEKYLCSLGENSELYTWRLSLIKKTSLRKDSKWLDFDPPMPEHSDDLVAWMRREHDEYSMIQLTLHWRSAADFDARSALIENVIGLTTQQKQYLLYAQAKADEVVNYQQGRQRDLVGYDDVVPLSNEIMLSACEQYRYFKVTSPYESSFPLTDILNAALEQKSLSTIKFLRGLGYRLLEPLYGEESLDYLFYKGQLCLDGNVTPFLLACWFGCLEIVYFLAYQWDNRFIALRTANGDSALVFAAENGHIDIIRYLIGEFNGEFPVENANLQGRTALSVAAENGHYEVVEYLVAQGSSPFSSDCEGNTPIAYAEKNGHVDVANYLKTIGNKKNSAVALCSLTSEKSNLRTASIFAEKSDNNTTASAHALQYSISK